MIIEGLWTANNQVLLIIYFVKVSVKIVNIFLTLKGKQLKMNCPDWNNNYEYESVKDLKKKTICKHIKMLLQFDNELGMMLRKVSWWTWIHG